MGVGVGIFHLGAVIQNEIALSSQLVGDFNLFIQRNICERSFLFVFFQLCYKIDSQLNMFIYRKLKMYDK